MRKKIVLMSSLVLLLGSAAPGWLNLGQSGGAADPCQAVREYKDALNEVKAAQDGFNKIKEPDDTVKDNWRRKNVLPSQWAALAETKKKDKGNKEAQCAAGTAAAGVRDEIDKLQKEIVELESLAAHTEANETLGKARRRLEEAQPAYSNAEKAKNNAAAKARADHMIVTAAWNVEKAKFKVITDAAKKRMEISRAAGNVVTAFKPILTGLKPVECFEDIQQMLEKLQGQLLKFEKLRVSIPSDMGEDLGDSLADLDLTDLTGDAVDFNNLPLATRAALAVAASAFPREKAPTLYPDQPGFNPSRAPGYLKTYKPGQYYSLTLPQGQRIVEIAVYQHGSAAEAQKQLAVWQDFGDPQNPARPVAWSSPDVPAFKKRAGIMGVAMEGTDDIVVRGRSGVWQFEVTVMMNQMGLPTAQSGDPLGDTARLFFLKLVENAKLFRLFP